MMTMDKFSVGSVVVDLNGSIGVVMEIRPASATPIIYAVKASGSLYRARLDMFKAVVGSVDVGALKAIMEEARAAKVRGFDDDFMVPEPLKGIKIGDKIKVRQGFGVKEVIYKGYNPNRPKMPVSYDDEGKSYKSTVSCVMGKVA